MTAIRTGQPIGANEVGRVVRRIAKGANVVVDKAIGKYATPHDFRRGFGTRWARKVKPATLQLLMRHKSLGTTMPYHVDIDADDVAAELWAEHRKSGAPK
jgi:integrase